MAEFQQFELQECFSLNSFERLPDSLRFDKSIKEEGKLYRLITGSVTIKNNITGDLIRQKNNYSILGRKEILRFSQKLFLEYFSSTTTLQNVDQYLKKSNPRNIPLFKDLINEYCYYFDYTNKGIHTLSFLHLYRILERISYTFPMLFAASAKDYTGTFGKLQSFFKSSDSELKFYNLFIADFFDAESLDFKVRFDISAFNEEIKKRYYKTLKQICNSNNPTIEIKDLDENNYITIENKNTFNLMIHIRNRYFHFLSGGQKNISSTELIEPNGFFAVINEHCLNWLSIVYFQLIKNEI